MIITSTVAMRPSIRSDLNMVQKRDHLPPLERIMVAEVDSDRRDVQGDTRVMCRGLNRTDQIQRVKKC
jgi:hypothetical protein